MVLSLEAVRYTPQLQVPSSPDSISHYLPRVDRQIELWREEHARVLREIAVLKQEFTMLPDTYSKFPSGPGEVGFTFETINGKKWQLVMPFHKPTQHSQLDAYQRADIARRLEIKQNIRVIDVTQGSDQQAAAIVIGANLGLVGHLFQSAGLISDNEVFNRESDYFMELTLSDEELVHPELEGKVIASPDSVIVGHRVYSLEIGGRGKQGVQKNPQAARQEAVLNASLRSYVTPDVPTIGITVSRKRKIENGEEIHSLRFKTVPTEDYGVDLVNRKVTSIR